MSSVSPYTESVIKAAETEASKMLDEFAGTMAAEAKTRSPHDTGHNRDSITHQTKGLNAEVYTESGYGGFLEVGTSRMAARPYFKPAFDAAKAAQ